MIIISGCGSNDDDFENFLAQENKQMQEKIANPPELTLENMRNCELGYYKSTEEKYRIYEIEDVYGMCEVIKYYPKALLREESKAGFAGDPDGGPSADIFILGFAASEGSEEKHSSVEEWFNNLEPGTINGTMFGY